MKQNFTSMLIELIFAGLAAWLLYNIAGWKLVAAIWLILISNNLMMTRYINK